MPEGEIYIPPEGAMQFQITNHEAPGMDSNLVLRANVAKLPDVIWVEGPPEKAAGEPVAALLCGL